MTLRPTVLAHSLWLKACMPQQQRVHMSLYAYGCSGVPGPFIRGWLLNRGRKR